MGYSYYLKALANPGKALRRLKLTEMKAAACSTTWSNLNTTGSMTG